jgi:hypothetical protein
MSGMNADRTLKIKKKMERTKTTIIAAEEEMEIMEERERNKDAPNEKGEPLETGAVPIAVEVQPRKKKFMLLTTAEKKKKKWKIN